MPIAHCQKIYPSSMIVRPFSHMGLEGVCVGPPVIHYFLLLLRNSNCRKQNRQNGSKKYLGLLRLPGKYQPSTFSLFYVFSPSLIPFITLTLTVSISPLFPFPIVISFPILHGVLLSLHPLYTSLLSIMPPPLSPPPAIFLPSPAHLLPFLHHHIFPLQLFAPGEVLHGEALHLVFCQVVLDVYTGTTPRITAEQRAQMRKVSCGVS